jgi:flagellum-specific ATP synthase
VLKSVSRTMPRACDPEFWPYVRKARQVLATFGDMEELIRLGAYRAGSSAEVDEAIALMPRLDAFLGQGKEESTSIGHGYARLADILGQA